MFEKIIGLFAPSRELTVSVRGQGVEFKVPRGQTILESALHHGLAFPHDCKVGSCGSCKYKLVSGKISELGPPLRCEARTDSLGSMKATT